MAQVTVENIVIKIGKKEIQLSLSEAKELQNVLEEMLGKKINIAERIIERRHWDYWKIEPYRITWDTGTGIYPPGTVLCTANR